MKSILKKLRTLIYLLKLCFFAQCNSKTTSQDFPNNSLSILQILRKQNDYFKLIFF